MNKMKLNLTAMSLVISSGLLFSCQPKDVTLTKPGGATNGTVNTMNAKESDKMLALSLDRHTESLHLLKAVMNADYAQAHGLSLVDNVLVSNESASKKTEMQTNQYVVSFDVKLEKDQNGKLKSLVLKNKVRSASESKGIINGVKPTDFVVKAKSEYISILATITEGEYAVVYDRIDETNSKADRKTALDVEMVSSLQWDGLPESLDSDLKVKLTSLAIERTGNKEGFLKFETITSDLTVKLAQCASVNGTITLVQKFETKEKDPVTKMTIPLFVKSSVVITDSSISITERAFSSNAQACEARPVVDLTKML